MTGHAAVVVVVAIACALVGTACAAPLFGTPVWSANGRVATHSFHHVDAVTGAFVHLSYSAEHVDGVVLLNERYGQVKCVPQADSLDVLLRFEPAHAADAERDIVAGARISGGVFPTCGTTSPFMRRVLSVSGRAAGEGLFVQLEEVAHPMEFFKTSDVQFNSNAWPRDKDAPSGVSAFYDKTHSPAQFTDETLEVHAGMVSRSWISDFFKKLWQGVVTIITVVYDIIKKVLPFIKPLILTGEISYGPAVILERNITYNYPNPQPIPFPTGINGVTLSCTECWAYADLSVIFTLKISEYTLRNLSVIAEGVVRALVTGDLSASWRGSFTWSATVATISPAPIVVPIAGIPFAFAFVMPIQAGATATLKAEAVAVAHAQAYGKISYGVAYDPTSKSVRQITSHSWDASGSIDKMHANFDADVVLWLLPMPALSVDYIADVWIGAKASLEVNADAEVGSSSKTLCGSNSLYVNINGGLAVTYGATVKLVLGSITLIDKQFGPNTIYSNRFPLVTGCVNFATPSPNPVVTPAVGCCGNGMLWTGTQKQIDCFDHLVIAPANVSVQLVQNDNNGVYMVRASNADFTGTSPNVWGTCISQALYAVGWNPSTLRIQMVPVTDSSSYVVGYASCDDPDIRLSAGAYVGVTSRDLNTITLYLVDPINPSRACGIMTVARQ